MASLDKLSVRIEEQERELRLRLEGSGSVIDVLAGDVNGGLLKGPSKH